MSDRDHAHTFPSGETVEVVGADGATHTISRPFRFQQGLRPADAAALDARPDLCAKLFGMGLWDESADNLDAAIQELLKESTP